MLIMIGTSSKGLSRSLYLLACIKRVIVLNSSRLFCRLQCLFILQTAVPVYFANCSACSFCRLQCLFHLNYTALPSKAVLSL